MLIKKRVTRSLTTSVQDDVLLKSGRHTTILDPLEKVQVRAWFSAILIKSGTSEVKDLREWVNSKSHHFDKTEWNLYRDLRQKPSRDTLMNVEGFLGIPFSIYIDGELPNQWAILSGHLPTCKLAVTEQVEQFKKYQLKTQRQKITSLLKSKSLDKSILVSREKSILDVGKRNPLTNEISVNDELSFKDIVFLFFEKMIDPSLRESIDFNHETNVVDMSYMFANDPKDGIPPGVIITPSLVLAVVGLFWMAQDKQEMIEETNYLLSGLIPNVIDNEFPDYSNEFKALLEYLRLSVDS